MDNEKKLIIKPKISIRYYFIRNIWMFLVLALVFILGLIVKSKFGTMPESMQEFGSHFINIVWGISTIGIIVAYLYKTIQMYLHTRRITYTFFDTYLRFEDEFLNKNSKDINYDKITEISMSQSIWDRMLQTGIIHIKTAVESDVGIYMPYIVNPKEVVEDIREVIGK